MSPKSWYGLWMNRVCISEKQSTGLLLENKSFCPKNDPILYHLYGLY